MAAVQAIQDVSAQGTGPQEASTQEVVDFLQLLNALASHQSTSFIEKTLKDNKAMQDTLKATLKEKQDEYDTFARVLAKLQNDLDREIETSKTAVAESDSAKARAGELTSEIEGAKNTIAEKCQALEAGAAAITGLKSNVETLEKEVKTRDDVIKAQEERQAEDSSFIKDLEGKLQTTAKELVDTSSQLKDLQSLSCKVVDESKEFVLAEINKIYGYALSVASTYFTEDLSDAILDDTHLFEGISRLVRPIPLPTSNSGPAKKARIAAFLASLGSKLADQIFVPFYLPPDENQDIPEGIDTITVMLSNLSHTDPKREIHLRSVLLAIAPEEQRKVAYERAEEIADDIFEDLSPLVNEERHRSFHHDVLRLCQLAVQSWDTLRPLKEKIEPFTETQEDTEKYWLPAELDGSTQAKKPQPNGKPNGLGSKPSLHSLKSAKGIKLVWPGFSYGKEVLKQGFMLLDSQIERASEEAPLKRNVRAMQRAHTASPVQTKRRSVTKKSKLFKLAD